MDETVKHIEGLYARLGLGEGGDNQLGMGDENPDLAIKEIKRSIVGRFNTKRSINFKVTKSKMASI